MSAYSIQTDPALAQEEFTDEELAQAHRHSMEQIRAGKFVRVSMEELEKMADTARGTSRCPYRTTET